MVPTSLGLRGEKEQAAPKWGATAGGLGAAAAELWTVERPQFWRPGGCSLLETEARGRDPTPTEARDVRTEGVMESGGGRVRGGRLLKPHQPLFRHILNGFALFMQIRLTAQWGMFWPFIFVGGTLYD